jgi:hypothetical protein
MEMSKVGIPGARQKPIEASSRGVELNSELMIINHQNNF